VIAARAAAYPPSQSTPADPTVVRVTIDEILAGPGFQKSETIFERIIEWIVEFLSDLLPEGSLSEATLSGLAQALVWIVLAAVVALVVWAIVRAQPWKRARADPEAAADPTVERAQRVAELRSRARAANARGEHVLALRLEFTALVVGLGERGDLEYRDAFTNRELLERGKPGRAAEALLRPIVPVLDRKSFGGEPATSDDFARLSSLCDQLLAGARA